MRLQEVGGMDPVRLGLGILATFVIVAIAGVVYFIRLENPTQRYATYDEAQRVGAMADGKWIPPFLPKSSKNIVETHDIDTNALEIEFDYVPGDVGALRTECTEYAPLQFSCSDWDLPVNVLLTPTGKGSVKGAGG
jgi:hypothetical protein